jgi:uncharacterized protein YjbJ (UPF0337 family)
LRPKGAKGQIVHADMVLMPTREHFIGSLRSDFRVSHIALEDRPMNKDRIAGAAKTGAGKAQQMAGKGVKSTKLQAKGMAKEAEGRAQNAAGKAKDAVKKAAKR